MSYTEKQERNGATGAAGGHNTAIPGPDETAQISGLIDKATGAALELEGQAAILLEGNGVGNGIAPGSMWDWADGLAITEVPGDAS